LNEATALQTSDIQISSRKGSVLIRQGKGGKQRSVPLNTEARKALQEWYAVRPESEFVWTEVEGDEGSSLTGRTIQRVLARYAIDANLENLSPHILRHSFAKNLVNAGVGLEKVAALLGHENLNTTRVYVTPGEKDLEDAVEELV
jgi:integrase/recombinase XerC